MSSVTAVKTRSERNSAIELLKIIAILLIVLNHVIQSLTQANPFIAVSDYQIDITFASSNLLNIILAVLRSSGSIGNDIFVVCSAWFLIGRERSDKRKVVFLIADIWVVSVAIFLITLACGLRLDRYSAVKQFFPTTNATNWFMTCYILFYLLHPLLNKLIAVLNQKAHLAVTLFLVLLYSICQFFSPWTAFFEDKLFYVTDLVVWITIYFIVAYVKLYLKDLSADTKTNVTTLLIGLAGQTLIVIAMNAAGLRFWFFSEKLLYFNYGGSPFIIMMAVAALNLARKSQLKSRFINYISGLSLLIYIIHENFIIRNCYRPLIFVYIHEHFGYDYVLLWLFAVVVAVFIAAVICAVIYSQTIERLVRSVSYKICELLERLYRRIEGAFLKLH